MTYSTWIVASQTGTKQRLVKAVSGSWERALNGTSQGTHVFRLNNSLTWQQWNDLFDGWRRMLVVCWNDVPVYAGFILRTDYDYPKNEVTVAHSSFRTVLSRRLPFGIGGYDEGRLVIDGQSKRGIVFKLIFSGTQGARSAVWDLPVTFPAYEEAGGESRVYENFAFQTIEAAITELTNSEGGPDIDFHPYWAVDGTLKHELRVGGPYLSGPQFEFDASATRRSLLLRTLTTDFAQMVTGAFTLGKGSGEIKYFGEDATVAAPGGYISLDITQSQSQLTDKAELDGHSREKVRLYSAPILQRTAAVIASKWLPDARPGALVKVRRAACDWRPAETLDLRVVRYAGDIKSGLITLKVA
jgi:hypothetical protein